MYHEKLRLFLKKEGVSQKEAADRLGHAPAMVSRFLSGTSVFDANFIIALVREFPSIDLNYIFSDQALQNTAAPAPGSVPAANQKNMIKEIEIIENKLSQIRTVLAQSCHKK